MKKRKQRRKKVERELLLSALALTCAVGGGDVSAQNGGDHNTALSALEIEAGAIAKRKEILNQVDGLVIKVSEAFAKSDIAKGYVAIDEINMLMSELKGQYGDIKREAVSKRIDKERLAFAKTLIKGIKSDINDKEYDAAQVKVDMSKKVLTSVDKLGMVEKLDADLYEDVLECDKLVTKRVDNLKLKAETELSHEDVAPELEQEKEDIKLLLAQAKAFRKADKFIEARDVIESILLKDVYNVAAISLLDKVYKDMHKIGERRRTNEMLQGIHEVEWNWNESVVAKRDTTVIAPPKVVSSNNAIISQKLREIFIDSIEFDGADVNTAVKYLTERSKELDKSGRGVSISASDALRKKIVGQTITMSLDNIPLGEALKYIGQKLGTSYTITELGVILGPVAQDMETRAIKVRPQLIATISESVDEGDDEVAEEDEFSVDEEFGGEETGDAGSSSASSEMIKKYFGARGIKFPENARLRYNSKSNKLFVTNTIDNITKLEELIRQLDIEVPLVLIEAKMLEIHETDLEDLGFNWNTSNGGFTSTSNGQGWSGGNNFYRSTGSLIQNGALDLDYSSGYTVVEGKKFYPGSSMGDESFLELDVVAIQQQKRGELLSAPKVIATSGETASVKMVAEHFFPESWSSPAIDTDRGTTTITMPTPMFGDSRGIGIQLDVTPNVTSNYTISMEVNPRITQLSQMRDYFYTIALDGQGYAMDNEGNLDFGQNLLVTFSEFLEELVWVNIWERDADGDLVLDANGDPIPIGFRWEQQVQDLNGNGVRGDAGPFFEDTGEGGDEQILATHQPANPLLQTITMPQISRREITANVKVYDGETIVLGGLLTEESRYVEEKNPFFSDLPLVGRLFSRMSKESIKKNVLIFITARLISGDGTPIRKNTDRGIPDFNR